MRITESNISRLSLSDREVIQMDFKLAQKTLELHMDAGYLVGSPILHLGRGNLKFSKWSAINITAYNAITAELTNRNEIENLKFVSEDSYSSEECVIKGFGITSGLWFEISIKQPVIEGEFDLANGSAEPEGGVGDELK